ncbi:MAG: hypothetical protein ACLQVL_31380 [Terriglobia bacterium]
MENEPETSGPRPNQPRLDGWEEIASFLGRGIRTVQRWEKEAALPVRRLFKQRRSFVHAYRKEMDDWVRGRAPHLPVSNPTSESPAGGDANLPTSRDVLAGWKEMAAFLGRSVRTVQRWEKQMGLPVQRLKSKARRIPYALRSELTGWLNECGAPVRSGAEGGWSVRPPALLQAIIDGYGANIAVLDTRGTVVGVNKAWKELGASHGCTDPNFGLGKDFLELCRSVAWAGNEAVSAATTGVLEVLNGARREIRVKYPRHRAAGKRWFSLHITRFNFRGSAFLIVAHDDITGLLED